MDSTTVAPGAAATGNSLVDRLKPYEYERLRHPFKAVELQTRQALDEPRDTITHAYFTTDAVATTVATMDDGATAETAMIGRDGVVGVGVAAGERSARHWTRVLVPGEGLRIDAQALREILED